MGGQNDETEWNKDHVEILKKFRNQLKNKSGKLSQDMPVLPQVVKLGHAPNKIQV